MSVHEKHFPWLLSVWRWRSSLAGFVCCLRPFFLPSPLSLLGWRWVTYRSPSNFKRAKQYQAIFGLALSQGL
jgi:hypothetical protein